jgi:hypothetical protein
VVGLSDLTTARRGGARLDESGSSSKSGRLFGYHPFPQPLFVPAVAQPYELDPAPGSSQDSLGSDAVFHGIAPEFSPDPPDPCQDWNAFFDGPFNTRYKLVTEETLQPIIPGGPETPVFSYRDANRPAVGKSQQMAAWGESLSDRAIRDLFAYVRTLAD